MRSRKLGSPLQFHKLKEMGDRLPSGIMYNRIGNIIESQRRAAKVDRLYSNIWQLLVGCETSGRSPAVKKNL
jgi:hypothetical protein